MDVFYRIPIAENHSTADGLGHVILRSGFHFHSETVGNVPSATASATSIFRSDDRIVSELVQMDSSWLGEPCGEL